MHDRRTTAPDGDATVKTDPVPRLSKLRDVAHGRVVTSAGAGGAAVTRDVACVAVAMLLLVLSACSSVGPSPVRPAAPHHEVRVVVQRDGSPLAGCSVGFVGSPADGSGLPEPGFISGEDGRVVWALPTGSYTVSALCDSVPGGAGERSFEVVDEDVEVVVEVVGPSS